MKIHNLKIQKKYFNEIIDGLKRFEIRKNDRDYKVGDIVHLNPFLNETPIKGRLIVKITYLIKDVPEYGLKDGYVIFGFTIILLNLVDNGKDFLKTDL